MALDFAVNFGVMLTLNCVSMRKKKGKRKRKKEIEIENLKEMFCRFEVFTKVMSS